MDMIQFVHASNWTEWIVNRFGRHVCSDPDECLHCAELALTSGVTHIWKNNKSNPFSLIAWLLTMDESKSETCCWLDQDIGHILNNLDIAQPLRTSLRIELLLRNNCVLLKERNCFLMVG